MQNIKKLSQLEIFDLLSEIKRLESLGLPTKHITENMLLDEKEIEEYMSKKNNLGKDKNDR